MHYRGITTLLTLDPITQFYMNDLVITATVAATFIIAESRRLQMKNTEPPIASIFLVGICLALPLFLYQREKHLGKKNSA